MRMILRVANNEEPDKMPRNAASHLVLQCLLISIYFGVYVPLRQRKLIVIINVDVTSVLDFYSIVLQSALCGQKN